MIAFTIGHKNNYDKALADEPTVYKIGRSEDYEGGWVWKNESEAWNFIKSDSFLKVDWGDGKSRNPNDFSVYKVKLPNSWEKDVIESDKTNYLLVNAEIIK